jgi:hypothetical protein
VLVEHPQGQLYRDGGRNREFYVPLQLLKLAGPPLRPEGSGSGERGPTSRS